MEAEKCPKKWKLLYKPSTFLGDPFLGVKTHTCRIHAIHLCFVVKSSIYPKDPGTFGLRLPIFVESCQTSEYQSDILSSAGDCADDDVTKHDGPKGAYSVLFCLYFEDHVGCVGVFRFYVTTSWHPQLLDTWIYPNRYTTAVSNNGVKVLSRVYWAENQLGPGKRLLPVS